MRELVALIDAVLRLVRHDTAASSHCTLLQL